MNRWGRFSIGLWGVIVLFSLALPGAAAWPAASVHALMGDKTKTKLAQPEGVDLDVTFIRRDPLGWAYCVEYQGGIPSLCPGSEDDLRWPEAGEVVTFTAHIRNQGTQDSPGFDYAWSIDSAPVLTGTLPGLAAGTEITTTYLWAWDHTLEGERLLGQHTVGFAADSQNLVTETYESNNLLEDWTNAMSFSIYITPEMYAAYKVPVTDTLPFSAEDWLQKQIAVMNANFALADYAATPGGARLRVRINTLEVHAENPAYDLMHDGGWFVDADYRHGASGYYDPATDIDWGLVHELSHQVGLIDLYASNIYASSVYVTDQYGQSANIGFEWPRSGLMGGGDIAPYIDSNRYSSHTAGGADSTFGYRNGYYGVYQYDIPQQNTLLILDSQGSPADNVQVTLFQRQGPEDWSGHIGIDDTPEMEGLTGADGTFLLPNRSANGGTVTHTGHTLHDNPFGVIDLDGVRNRFLIRLCQGTHEEFYWLDVTAFNLAYCLGDSDQHTFTIASHVPPAGAPLPPTQVLPHVEGDQLSLCWQPSLSPGVSGYHVYRASPPDYLYQPASGLVTDTCFNESIPAGNYGGTVYAVAAMDTAGRESGFERLAWTPDLVNPAGVVIAPDGSRLVLDPQNGYAVLAQSSDGRYLRNIGSVHYHLENTRFFNLDANDHLIFSHPGDWYDGRHSVRISDLELTPLLEFGTWGSEPGQFDSPAGVAAFDNPCTFVGPLADDEHTLLLLHWNGGYTGTQGEAGVPNGTELVAGRYGQGAAIDLTDTLTYTAAGNFNLSQGAVEFWVQPAWDGNDNQTHIFLDVGEPWQSRMLISKDGGNNLRFLIWDSSREYGLAYSVVDWQAGEWHHLAATWQEGYMALYVDGLQVKSTSDARPPDVMPTTLYVGSSVWEDYQANAVLDELRISDLPRLGDSDACNQILVADSGNHRIQAFDSLGNFLDVLGSLGSGPGQFNQPQGLAVDSTGRIIVADQGNHRLVLLSFDGEALGYLGEWTAGLSSPVGVAVDRLDRVYVADTGNNRIVVLSRDGTLLAEFTEPTDGQSGAFLAPFGVAVQADGTIVVADTGNRRVAAILQAMPVWMVYLPSVVR